MRSESICLLGDAYLFISPRGREFSERLSDRASQTHSYQPPGVQGEQPVERSRLEASTGTSEGVSRSSESCHKPVSSKLPSFLVNVLELANHVFRGVDSDIHLGFARYSMTPIVSAISSARASSLRLCSDRSAPSMMLTASSIPNTLILRFSGSLLSRNCFPVLDFGSQRTCKECL